MNEQVDTMSDTFLFCLMRKYRIMKIVVMMVFDKFGTDHEIDLFKRYVFKDNIKFLLVYFILSNLETTVKVHLL